MNVIINKAKREATTIRWQYLKHELSLWHVWATLSKAWHTLNWTDETYFHPNFIFLLLYFSEKKGIVPKII